MPSRLDRAQGDIHAAGNPHIQTDPRNILMVAKPLADRFAELDPAECATLRSPACRFHDALACGNGKMASAGRTAEGRADRGRASNLDLSGNLAGLETHRGARAKTRRAAVRGYLAQVVGTLQKTPAKMVIRAAYEDDRPSQFISERARIPAVTLPFTVGGTDGAKDLFSLYDDTINRLLAALKG